MHKNFPVRNEAFGSSCGQLSSTRIPQVPHSSVTHPCSFSCEALSYLFSALAFPIESPHSSGENSKKALPNILTMP
ncbi:hypothetical protein EUGRSUZ_F02673 [Eucalyptus grandis]|uniref:Uncharacterized protein n=2 Tax=Eucalyptus grandis TaxID=71139 RepID=A0ACC3KJ56_EUCGR|nr:hypothetical protein EUGRSUZ_F02673 [Eucalyptus grandis]